MKFSPFGRWIREFGYARSARLRQPGTWPPSGPNYACFRSLYFACAALLLSGSRSVNVFRTSFRKSQAASAARSYWFSGPRTPRSTISMRTCASAALLCSQCAESPIRSELHAPAIFPTRRYAARPLELPSRFLAFPTIIPHTSISPRWRYA